MGPRAIYQDNLCAAFGHPSSLEPPKIGENLFFANISIGMHFREKSQESKKDAESNFTYVEIK